MVNLALLTAEICWRVRLGSVTARHSSSGRQPNFAALNRGRRLYSAGRPSRWALAHILVVFLNVSNNCTKDLQLLMKQNLFSVNLRTELQVYSSSSPI